MRCSAHSEVISLVVQINGIATIFQWEVIKFMVYSKLDTCLIVNDRNLISFTNSENLNPSSFYMQGAAQIRAIINTT